MPLSVPFLTACMSLYGKSLVLGDVEEYFRSVGDVVRISFIINFISKRI